MVPVQLQAQDPPVVPTDAASEDDRRPELGEDSQSSGGQRRRRGDGGSDLLGLYTSRSSRSWVLKVALGPWVLARTFSTWPLSEPRKTTVWFLDGPADVSTATWLSLNLQTGQQQIGPASTQLCGTCRHKEEWAEASNALSVASILAPPAHTRLIDPSGPSLSAGLERVPFPR